MARLPTLRRLIALILLEIAFLLAGFLWMAGRLTEPVRAVGTR